MARNDDRDRDGGDRRPLLARGERLKHEATRPRNPRKKFHPLTLEQAWSTLRPLGAALSASVDLLPRERRGRHVVFEATLLPNYLASSYYPERVLDRSDLYVVGARNARARKVTKTKIEDDQPTRTLLVAGAPPAVKRFAKRLADPPSARNEQDWEELRRFSTVSLPRAESVIVRRPEATEAGRVTFEAVLSHVFDAPQNRARWADDHFAQFVRWIDAHGGLVDAEYRRDLPGLTFVPVLTSAEKLDEIAQFNLLRAIRPMPEIAPFPDDVMRIAVTRPMPSTAALKGEVPSGVVALFDGGVDPALDVFAPFVTSFDQTPEAATSRAMRHGSMVTSALLYGSVDPSTQLPDPTTAVHHHRVFPLPVCRPGTPDHRLYEMLDRIMETLRANDYSMVVMAMGPNDSIDDNAAPDRFTSEFDAIAKERNITVISAVGNNGELDSQLGFDRVQPPGDMVNGIGVGAISMKQRDPKHRWERATYSARGPGREGQRVQPLVVEFGGCDADPFVGFDERGRLVRAKGTSFAAPAAGRAIAGLRGALDTARQQPAILRAFAVHNAERGYGHKKRFLELGYGRVPENFDHAFRCAPNEVTVLYEDELPRGQPTALRFPLPADLPPDTTLRIRWTISYVTDVDPRDATDYTVSGIEVVFRPDHRARSLTNPFTKSKASVRLDTDAAQIRVGLTHGHTLSQEPTARSQWCYTKGEQRLRQDGKWETILCGSVRPSVAKLDGPRLDLLHLRRENGRLVSGDAIEPLPFAMLLTISAPKNVMLYDMVASQYHVLTPMIQMPLRVVTVA